MSTLRNFYEILDSTPSATFDELKSNYKQLILQCHPDKLQQDKNQQPAQTTDVTTNNTNVAATVDPNASAAATKTNSLCDREFVAINEAWNTLKDPAKRKLYDAELLLSKFQTHSNIYERLKLSDMKRTSINAEEIIYTYNCRCGGQYIVDDSEESALIFERSQHKNDNCVDKDNKTDNDNHDVVTDNDNDDDDEVIVECNECSLVIILNG